MKSFRKIAIISIMAFIWSQLGFSQCTNGNLEAGNLSGFNAFTGTNNGGSVSLNSIVAGAVNGRHTIMTGSGNDPYISQIPLVYEGNHSVRLGNDQGGKQADLLTYTFNVTPQNEIFEFSYAVVLQDPANHTQSETPFFSYILIDGTNPILNPNTFIGGSQIIADLANPFFNTIPGTDIVYRNWTPICVDLSAYSGRTVTILFLTADCSLGQHFGYAYIDGLCEDLSATAKINMASTFCQSDPITADGSQSQNEVKYFWSVVETNSQGNPIGPEKSAHYIGQAGSMNIKNFYESRGGVFECGKHYRVKVAVSNDCTQWSEDSKHIYIECPSFDVGDDIVLCCDDLPSLIQLGNNEDPNFSFNYGWFYGNEQIGNTPNLDIPIPASSGTYTLVVTDPITGCTGRDTVNVLLIGDFNINITENRHGACNEPITLTVSATPDLNDCDADNSPELAALKLSKLNFVWNTNETDLSIDVDPTSQTQYSVTASYECYSKTVSRIVDPCPEIRGPFPVNDFIWPNAFTPTLNTNNVFNIFHIGFNNFPAFNATEYRFLIFNRWGNVLVDIQGETDRCEGFVSGQIPAWDGRTTHTYQSVWWDPTTWNPPAIGTMFPPNTLVAWQLRLRNCDTGWTTVLNGEYVTLVY